MKKLLAAMFVALLMVGCGEEAQKPGGDSPESNQSSVAPTDAKPAQVAKVVVDGDKIELRDGLFYFKGEPFTGGAVEKADNGQKEWEATFKDGELISHKEWDEDGNQISGLGKSDIRKEDSAPAAVQPPQGWLTSKTGVDELSALAQPGKWKGTHVIHQDDQEVVSVKVEENIAYGNGGKCLVKFTRESASNVASHSLQAYTYDPANDVYRHLIVFDNGNFLVQEGKWDEEKKNLNFVVTHSSDPSLDGTSNTTTFSEEGKRWSWNWQQSPTVSPRMSGTGQVKKVE